MEQYSVLADIKKKTVSVVVCYLGDLRAAVGLRHLVGEVGLLEARSAHSLVGGGVGARRGVRRVEAGLDQSFARL